MVRQIKATPLEKRQVAAVKSSKGKKKRVAVFIDGSNFYFKLKTLLPDKTDLVNYRYRDLITHLLAGDEMITFIGYYVGIVRDTKKTKDHDKSQELIKNQQRLFEQLKHQKIELVKGYLLERDGKFFEKGVDVRLALDIVAKAYQKKYDVAYVLTSDTDLIPAIQQAKERGREIVYVGFEHQPSLALMRYASRARIITKKEAAKFYATPLQIRRFDEE
jgi:uncharacterized LabA/DUF88 family protein